MRQFLTYLLSAALTFTSFPAFAQALKRVPIALTAAPARSSPSTAGALTARGALTIGGVISMSEISLLIDVEDKTQPVSPSEIELVGYDTGKSQLVFELRGDEYSYTIAAEELAALTSFVANEGSGIFTYYSAAVEEYEEGYMPCRINTNFSATGFGYCAAEIRGVQELESQFYAVDFAAVGKIHQQAQELISYHNGRIGSENYPVFAQECQEIELAVGFDCRDADYEVSDFFSEYSMSFKPQSRTVSWAGYPARFDRLLVRPNSNTRWEDSDVHVTLVRSIDASSNYEVEGIQSLRFAAFLRSIKNENPQEWSEFLEWFESAEGQ